MDRIYQHDYSPDFPRFLRTEGDPDGVPYFGFELEVEYQRFGDFSEGQANNPSDEFWRQRQVFVVLEQEAERIYNKFPGLDSLVYMKRDGSIYGGFEIVSYPMTERFIKEQFFSVLNSLLDYLRERGFTSYSSPRSSCGFHVHTSKDAIGNIQLFKMMNFVFSNPLRMLKLSQRKKEFLQKYASLNIDHNLRSKIAKAKGWLGKYTAINLKPPETVELRLMRGNLRRSRFWKNLEFAMALYTWTKDCSIDESKNWNAFVRWVKSQGDRYARLFEFLAAVSKSSGESNEPFSIGGDV